MQLGTQGAAREPGLVPSDAVIPRLRVGAVAGLLAGLPSGLPSTVHALVTAGDPLRSTRAAGALLLGSDARSWRLVVAALPVHLTISGGWGMVLGASLPRRPRSAAIVSGALAGLAIAALDLGTVGRRNRAVRALPLWPQVADHVAYGVLAAWLISRRPGPAPQ